MNYDAVLCGLTYEEREHVEKLIDQIEYNDSNEIINQCLVPIFRYLVTRILEKDTNYLIKENRELLIKLINVKNITTRLISLVTNFLPIAKNIIQMLIYKQNQFYYFAKII